MRERKRRKEREKRRGGGRVSEISYIKRDKEPKHNAITS